MNEVIQKFIGKKIQKAALDNDVLRLVFDDGSGLEIQDSGQCCCEARYMTTDDVVSDLVGECLAAVEEKPTEYIEEDYESHDIAFLEVVTDRGTRVNFAFHNEHNGYYGGFSLDVEAI